jgi:hypothetical protein
MKKQIVAIVFGAAAMLAQPLLYSRKTVSRQAATRL